MPVVGERQSNRPGSEAYAKDPMHSYAKSFLESAKSILDESRVDLFTETAMTFRKESAENTMRDFFVEGSCDKDSMSPEQYEDHITMMNEMFTNDKEAILEHSMAGNPVIGLTHPIHKNIMMNTVFDNGIIPKFVAVSPKITTSMETRWLIDPVTGEKIDFWKEQYRMTDVIEKAAPMKSMYLPLPEAENTNILQTLFGVNSPDDHLSIESHISGLVAETKVVFPGESVNVVVSDASGETSIIYYTNNTTSAKLLKAGVADADIDGTIVGVVYNWKGEFTPAYGTYDVQLMEEFILPITSAVTAGTLTGTWKVTTKNGVIDNVTSDSAIGPAYKEKGFMSGFSKDDRFGLTVSNEAVIGCIFTTRLDTSSAMLRTASVSWEVRTDIFAIPNAIPINVTLAPEEVKDISALYNVNQMTKVMSLIKTSLNNYKDDKIKRALDISFVGLPSNQKVLRSFDFAPPNNYLLDPIEWRNKMFMDSLDTHVTQLIHVLNDPNMMINVIGRDDLIRKITPTEYTYQSPSNIGPVELDFVKTVVTSDKRCYQFMSTDKMRDSNNLIVLLTPRNSERFIYRIYDYQMYISNEIRNAPNPSLPAIHAFERWVFKEYQPVQGRVLILNPTGLRNYAQDYSYNPDPIGRGDGQGVASIGKNDFDIDARTTLA